MAGITVDIDPRQDGNYKHEKTISLHTYKIMMNPSGDNVLFAQEGDNIYVEYTDTTLPRKLVLMVKHGTLKSDHYRYQSLLPSVTSGYPYITIR